MKKLQKLILPVLFLIVIFIVYTIYFAPKNELGLFSNFDTNNSGNKDIRVVINTAKEINNDPQSGSSSFYAVDAKGKEVLVQGPVIPKNIDTSKAIILRGHLHTDHFHAVEILQDSH